MTTRTTVTAAAAAASPAGRNRDHSGINVVHRGAVRRKEGHYGLLSLKHLRLREPRSHLKRNDRRTLSRLEEYWPTRPTHRRRQVRRNEWYIGIRRDEWSTVFLGDNGWDNGIRHKSGGRLPPPEWVWRNKGWALTRYNGWALTRYNDWRAIAAVRGT